jgi:hypothetical protein
VVTDKTGFRRDFGNLGREKKPWLHVDIRGIVDQLEVASRTIVRRWTWTYDADAEDECSGRYTVGLRYPKFLGRTTPTPTPTWMRPPRARMRNSPSHAGSRIPLHTSLRRRHSLAGSRTPSRAPLSTSTCVAALVPVAALPSLVEKGALFLVCKGL